MPVSNKSYYEILGVSPECDFQQIKKAYYRRAKECHPDLFNNCQQKTEEFKLVVMAFDVLSDPEKRYRYDGTNVAGEASTMLAAAQQVPIMDTIADDILEELIVGNSYPANTSLATILLDLTKTEIFMTFREGKNLFFAKRLKSAKSFLLNAVSMSPHNIIFRIYLARCFALIGEYESAVRHYRSAIAIGHKRTPPQHLFRIKKELDYIKKNHHPILSMLLSFFEKPAATFIQDSDQKLIEEMNRMLTILDKEQQQSERRRIKK
jgi:tetratricopeptide (TPR) repeat protein